MQQRAKESHAWLGRMGATGSFLSTPAVVWFLPLEESQALQMVTYQMLLHTKDVDGSLSVWGAHSPFDHTVVSC